MAKFLIFGDDDKLIDSFISKLDGKLHCVRSKLTETTRLYKLMQDSSTSPRLSSPRCTSPIRLNVFEYVDDNECDCKYCTVQLYVLSSAHSLSRSQWKTLFTDTWTSIIYILFPIDTSSTVDMRESYNRDNALARGELQMKTTLCGEWFQNTPSYVIVNREKLLQYSKFKSIQLESELKEYFKDVSSTTRDVYVIHEKNETTFCNFITNVIIAEITKEKSDLEWSTLTLPTRSSSIISTEDSTSTDSTPSISPRLFCRIQSHANRFIESMYGSQKTSEKKLSTINMSESMDRRRSQSADDIRMMQSALNVSLRNSSKEFVMIPIKSDAPDTIKKKGLSAYFKLHNPFKTY